MGIIGVLSWIRIDVTTDIVLGVTNFCFAFLSWTELPLQPHGVHGAREKQQLLNIKWVPHWSARKENRIIGSWMEQMRELQSYLSIFTGQLSIRLSINLYGNLLANAYQHTLLSIHPTPAAHTHTLLIHVNVCSDDSSPSALPGRWDGARRNTARCSFVMFPRGWFETP